MQPQNCSNGPSSLSSDDHMQQVHHRHPNQKSAIAATATTAASAGAASSASPLFPTSLRHHFQKMDQEGFDHAPPPHDDFIEQMLSSLNPASAWHMKNGCENDSALPEEESENGVSAGGFQFDESSKLRAQQMLPIRFDGMDEVVHHSGTLLEGSSYDSFQPGVENQMAGLFNGISVGSLLGSGHQMNHLPEHFHGSQGGPAFDQVSVAMNSNGHAPMDGAAEAAATQPKQRVRARRGQATDPHSIAERLRRERIAERMKGLQELVPNANKTDKASMLDEIIEYVKFLQLQVKVLSMSRLGGAGAVAPLVGDNMWCGGDSLKARAKAMMRCGGSNEEVTETSNTTEEVNEKQVAKLLEEDMGSAMQYLQSKGLCLMPISLAAAISTARNPLSSSSSTKRAGTNSSPSDS